MNKNLIHKLHFCANKNLAQQPQLTQEKKLPTQNFHSEKKLQFGKMWHHTMIGSILRHHVPLILLLSPCPQHGI